MAQLPKTSDRLKRCIIKFLARLIKVHYNSEFLEKIVSFITNTFAKGESAAERCLYIIFFEESINILDSSMIHKYFLDDYIDLIRREKNPRVQKLFITALIPLFETARLNHTNAVVEKLHDMAFTLEKYSWP